MSDSVNAHIDEIITENKKKPFFADEETEAYKSTCTENGSAAAAPRGEALAVNPLHTEQARILSVKDNERQRKWFDYGVRAKQRGYGDLSPFYENKTADYFFKCGYAGTSFEQAQETLRTEIEQILKQDSTLSESVNDLIEDNNEPRMSDFLP